MLLDAIIDRFSDVDTRLCDDGAPLAIFKHLEDLGWLRFLQWRRYPSEKYGPSYLDLELFLTYSLDEDNPLRSASRVYLEFITRGDGIIARCAFEKREPGISWPSTDHYWLPTVIHSYCSTLDPMVMEFWLRRQPIDWAMLENTP